MEKELRSLWASVLLRSLMDYAGVDLREGKAGLLRYAAENWIFSSSEGLGSFAFCCHVLGLDFDAVRGRIRELGPEGLRLRMQSGHRWIFPQEEKDGPAAAFEATSSRPRPSSDEFESKAAGRNLGPSPPILANLA